MKNREQRANSKGCRAEIKEQKTDNEEQLALPSDCLLPSASSGCPTNGAKFTLEVEVVGDFESRISARLARNFAKFTPDVGQPVSLV